MRYLEVRRHSVRAKDGQNLIQDGVTLARTVGQQMGHFDLVMTSPLPRAYQTALAMGYAVHDTLDGLATMPAGIPYPLGFKDYASGIRRGGVIRMFAEVQAALWHSVIAALPEGSRLLFISHGGLIELGTVCCLPEANHEAWGGPLSYCEGVRLGLEGDLFVQAEILRV
jgi:broad specificity phosphatase PhoE